MKNTIVTVDVDSLIYTMRGQRVMLDRDLGKIYGVPVKRLNEQVRRNKNRFPRDFMFQLTKEELEILRSQFATLKRGHGQHEKYLPFVFTEHGAVMLGMVLKSPIAIAASVGIVRAFNRLRQLVNTHKDLALALEKLEAKVSRHDEHIQTIFAAIHEIMAPPIKPAKKIGFSPK